MTLSERIEMAAEQYYQDRPLGFGEPKDDFTAGAQFVLNEVKGLVEALEKIKDLGRRIIPCPDDKEGCLVMHSKLSKEASIAREALAKWKEGE